MTIFTELLAASNRRVHSCWSRVMFGVHRECDLRTLRAVLVCGAAFPGQLFLAAKVARWALPPTLRGGGARLGAVVLCPTGSGAQRRKQTRFASVSFRWALLRGCRSCRAVRSRWAHGARCAYNIRPRVACCTRPRRILGPSRVALACNQRFRSGVVTVRGACAPWAAVRRRAGPGADVSMVRRRVLVRRVSRRAGRT